MSGSICKWCNKTELVFDNAYKSKTGKLIPLDKTSGLPHQCSENPYIKQQQQSDDVDVPKLAPSLNLSEMIHILQSLEQKIDHLTKLVYALSSQSQKQEDNVSHDRNASWQKRRRRKEKLKTLQKDNS